MGGASEKIDAHSHTNESRARENYQRAPCNDEMHQRLRQDETGIDHPLSRTQRAGRVLTRTRVAQF